MPLLRSTMRRALEGRPPTMPRTASMASLPTGSSGRNAPVLVTYTSLLIQNHSFGAGPRRQVELRLQAREALAHERAQQRLYKQAQRHQRQDQGNQEQHVQDQHGQAAQLSRFA